MPVFVLMAEVILVDAPASEGFEGDAEPVFDEVDVAVVLIEEVERFDFGIERVAGRHKT